MDGGAVQNATSFTVGTGGDYAYGLHTVKPLTVPETYLQQEQHSIPLKM